MLLILQSIYRLPILTISTPTKGVKAVTRSDQRIGLWPRDERRYLADSEAIYAWQPAFQYAKRLRNPIARLVSLFAIPQCGTGRASIASRRDAPGCRCCYLSHVTAPVVPDHRNCQYSRWPRTGSRLPWPPRRRPRNRNGRWPPSTRQRTANATATTGASMSAA